MNMLNGLDTRRLAHLGLTVLGLVLAVPAQAAPDFSFADGSVLLAAKRDRDEVRQDDRRDTRQNERRDARREVERDEPHGYGYGYERREHQRFEHDGRPERRSRN
jgi:hypothetical protein